MPCPANRSPESDAWFSQAIRADLPHLRRTVRRVAGDSPLDPDELAQVVLLRLWAHWETVGGLQRPARRAWINRTVRNLAVDMLRRHGSEPVDLVTAVPEHARVTADTAEVYSQHEDMRGLIAAVRGLPKKDRDLVLDRVLSEDPLRVLAERHGMTTEAIKKRLQRLRNLLTDPRKHVLSLHMLVMERRVVRWMRTRGADPLATAPARALSFAMSGVLVMAGVPVSSDAVGHKTRLPAVVRDGPGVPSSPVVADAGAATAGPGLLAAGRSRAARPARPRPSDRRPTAPPDGGVRVTACVLATCATAGRPPNRRVGRGGHTVYVDLPREAGGRTGVTQNRVKVCDVFPSTPPDLPAGCERP